MPSRKDCPSRDQIKKGVRGGLSAPQLERLAVHVESCPACEETLQSLYSQETLVNAPDNGDSELKALIERVRRKSRSKDVNASAIQESFLDAANRPTMSFLAGGSAIVDAIEFLAPPQLEGEIGRLGHYRVLKILGQGGMGMVLLAHDPNLDRQVALKIMLPKIAAVEVAKQRFLREARTAAKLKSDNIVTIYQVGEDRGVPFLAMEYLRGAPLDKYLVGGRKLTVPQILRIGREVARGLADAHEQGLIHRDIKPANIWLDKVHNGRATILDFGLAREDTDASITHSGAVVGTPAYMAPEQARGERVDARADLFSLGCLLYRLCAGEVPFKGATTMAVLTALATVDPPQVSSVNPEIPQPLSDLVMQLLSKDLTQRPDSARDVFNRLTDIGKSLSAPPTTTTTVVADQTISPSSTEKSFLDAVQQARSETIPPMKSSVQSHANGPRTPTTLKWAGLGFAGLSLLSGIILFWPAAEGVVRFEIDDPAIKVVIDKDGPTVTGADSKPISLKQGAHGMRITRGDFTFDTTNFELRKGDKTTLRIDWLPGKLQVLRDGKPFDAKDRPREDSAKSTPPTTPKSPPTAWVELFDGNTLNSWTPIGFNGWKVEGQAMVGETASKEQIGWLMISRDYGDYELELEYQLSPGSKSGVFLRAWQEGDVSGKDFCEVQLLDSTAPEFAALDPTSRTGAIVGQIAPTTQVASPPNQWHSLHVVLQGKHIRVTMNGSPVSEGDLTKPPRSFGRLGLQLHPKRVEFRNIRIHEIPAATPSTPGGSTSAADKPATHAWEDVFTEVVRLPIKPYVVSFFPDGGRAVFGTGGARFFIFDLATGRKHLECSSATAGEGPIPTLLSAIPGPERRIYTSHADGSIRVWDDVRGEKAIDFQANPLGQPFGELLFSVTGGWIASLGRSEIRLWDASGKEMRRQDSSAVGLALHPDGKRLVSVDANGRIRVFDAISGKESATFVAPPGRLAKASYSPDGRRILCRALGRQNILVLDADDGRVVRTLPTAPPRDAAYFPDSRFVLISTRDNIVRVWDVVEDQVVASKASSVDMPRVAVSPNGRFAVVTTTDETIVYETKGPLRLGEKKSTGG